MKRMLGRSGIEVSALGLGCWAIGGPFWAGETPLGWGEVDDKEGKIRFYGWSTDFPDRAEVFAFSPRGYQRAWAISSLRSPVFFFPLLASCSMRFRCKLGHLLSHPSAFRATLRMSVFSKA
jgi:hypothetical protein